MHTYTLPTKISQRSIGCGRNQLNGGPYSRWPCSWRSGYPVRSSRARMAASRRAGDATGGTTLAPSARLAVAPPLTIVHAVSSRTDEAPKSRRRRALLTADDEPPSMRRLPAELERRQPVSILHAAAAASADVAASGVACRRRCKNDGVVCAHPLTTSALRSDVNRSVFRRTSQAIRMTNSFSIASLRSISSLLLKFRDLSVFRLSTFSFFADLANAFAYRLLYPQTNPVRWTMMACGEV